MIEESFIDEFRVAQKELVRDLSVDIVVGFGSMLEEDCPNCAYIGDGSGDFSDFVGSVTLFSGTAYERIVQAKYFKQRCPVCSGKGYLSVPNEVIIKAHVWWGSSSSDNYAKTYPNSPAGWSGQAQVKIKTDSYYYQDFLAAKYFLINGVRVEPSTTPLLRSMKGTTGIVEIWCKTTETGKGVVS